MSHHQHNFLARVMDGRFVHGVVGFLVVLNAAILGAMTYYSPSDVFYQQLTQVDQIILWIFVGEIGLRLLANGTRFFRNPWNIFDFVVIFGSLIPYPAGFSVLRSLRVLRLFYLIEISQKMRHILHGLYLSFSGIIHVALLMVIVFYAFAVMGVGLFSHADVAQFKDLTAAFHTLFQVLTGDDWYNVLREVAKQFPHAWVFFYAYYLAMSFVILNLFIGVIVGALQNAEEDLERGSDTSSSDKDSVSSEVQASLSTLKSELAALRREIKQSKPRATPSRSKKSE
jgi:voltage-gated sodium channel